jgi:urea transporter
VRKGILDAVDGQLRAIGQLMFQDHPVSGLLFLAGIFVESAPLGLAAVLGLCGSTLTAHALGADRLLIRQGFFGFNGFYAGLGIAFYLGSQPVSWLYILLGGASTTLLTLSVAGLLKPWNLPPLTAPYVVVLWTILLVEGGLGALAPQGATGAAPSPERWAGMGLAGFLVSAVLRSVGQVFFQDSAVSGALILAGVAVGSQSAACIAALGALGGVVTAVVLGVSRPLILQGIYGYNSCLGALAIACGFIGLSRRTFALGAMCAIASAALTAACGALLAPWRLPVASIPFTLATWTFLLIERSARDRSGSS